jgi:hypothetical protein
MIFKKNKKSSRIIKCLGRFSDNIDPKKYHRAKVNELIILLRFQTLCLKKIKKTEIC